MEGLIQLGGMVGFPENWEAFFDRGLDRIAVARREQDGHRRPPLADPPRQIETVHSPWHDEIGEDNIIAGVLLESSQGIGT